MMTIFKLSEQEAGDQILSAARSMGISFSTYEPTIRQIVSDIYSDGVFLKSFLTVGSGETVSARGLSQLDANAATNYVLAKCRARNIPLFFVKGHITRVTQALYGNGLAFVVGPGKLMNLVAGKGGL